MPIECVWLGDAPDRPARPGEMFFDHDGFPDLSKHYQTQVRVQRRPIWVGIPTRSGPDAEFCIDAHPTDEPDGAWTITIAGPLVVGERPPITVAPSINCEGLYHGFLQNGVLTDDLG